MYTETWGDGGMGEWDGLPCWGESALVVSQGLPVIRGVAAAASVHYLRWRRLLTSSIVFAALEETADT